jgi:hypothetical protein
VDNVLTVTKCMRAEVNRNQHQCEQCGRVPDTLYRFWHLLPGEDGLHEAVVRLLPAFCGHACWRVFVNGKQFSDRSGVRENVGVANGR